MIVALHCIHPAYMHNLNISLLIMYTVKHILLHDQCEQATGMYLVLGVHVYYPLFSLWKCCQVIVQIVKV